MIKSYKILTAMNLKILLILLMVLDHSRYVYGLVNPELADFFCIISRGVAPVFGYLLLEGIQHTRSLLKFNLRLWIWTILVSLGNVLLYNYLLSIGSEISHENLVYLSVRTNICITLASAVTCFTLLEISKKINDKLRWIYYLGAIIFFVIGFVFEWGVTLLPFMMVVYFYKNDKVKRIIGYFVVLGIAILLRSEIYFMIALPFIAFYNGKRGSDKAISKYFFYVFYPMHIWLISIVNYFILAR